MKIEWNKYSSDNFYDEFMSNGHSRQIVDRLTNYLASLDSNELAARQAASEVAIKEMGITFTVYTNNGGSLDRSWPYDIIPRVIDIKEWRRVEIGLKQRAQALNMFIDDIYHEQSIIKDKVIPADLVIHSTNFRPQCMGMTPIHNIWAHVCGSDLVRDKDGTIYVLEDNLRVPSGVSYMLENRLVTKRVFPELFENLTIMPVDDYPVQLFDTLAALSPRCNASPTVVVLTPGIFNSAYFEHAYLSQQMGCELVEGRDLIVDTDDCVYMRTINGLQRVDVIYRRVDDLFLDPEVFNQESLLGVPGLMRAWRSGNVALANAPGAGVADDKVIYAYVPKMIEYYLKEQAILPNVPTYLCFKDDERDYVLANLDKLVVKPANESGGYGLLIGSRATKHERDMFSQLITSNPRNYVAQPVINISTVPTIAGASVEPRHVDLRPFILSSEKTVVTTGGLTRVALNRGSLVVNSSQGGGSKDTWILDPRGA